MLLDQNGNPIRNSGTAPGEILLSANVRFTQMSKAKLVNEASKFYLLTALYRSAFTIISSTEHSEEFKKVLLSATIAQLHKMGEQNIWATIKKQLPKEPAEKRSAVPVPVPVPAPTIDEINTLPEKKSIDEYQSPEKSETKTTEEIYDELSDDNDHVLY